MTYSFLGHDVPTDVAARLAEGLVLRDDRDGTHIVRKRTARLVPLRCVCGHHERMHGTDRNQRPVCWGSQVCACTTYTAEPTR
jgi:hypothetical protein